MLGMTRKLGKLPFPRLPGFSERSSLEECLQGTGADLGLVLKQGLIGKDSRSHGNGGQPICSRRGDIGWRVTDHTHFDLGACKFPRCSERMGNHVGAHSVAVAEPAATEPVP